MIADGSMGNGRWEGFGELAKANPRRALRCKAARPGVGVKHSVRTDLTRR